MSALGQKQTCAVQNVMSALPPIATLIAKFGMSAKCQQRTSASGNHSGVFEGLTSEGGGARASRAEGAHVRGQHSAKVSRIARKHTSAVPHNR
jgi:hypothetical protein